MKFLYAIVDSILICSYAIASPQWTSSDPWTGGIQVVAVFPHVADKKIQFKGSDGNFYSYQWDINSNDMTSNAGAILSTLMTAFASGKKVNVLYDPSIVEAGYMPFTKIILLN